MHLRHIALQVNNMDQSIAFYELIPELKVARREQAGPGEIAFLSNCSGATEIELICMPQGQKYEGKGIFLCFQTDKLEEMHQLAIDKELKPSPIQNPGDGTFYFYVYDPNGVSVQLRSFPA